MLLGFVHVPLGANVYPVSLNLLLALVVATAAIAKQNVETVKNNFTFFIKQCLKLNDQ